MVNLWRLCRIITPSWCRGAPMAKWSQRWLRIYLLSHFHFHFYASIFFEGVQKDLPTCLPRETGGQAGAADDESGKCGENRRKDTWVARFPPQSSNTKQRKIRGRNARKWPSKGSYQMTLCPTYMYLSTNDRLFETDKKEDKTGEYWVTSTLARHGVLALDFAAVYLASWTLCLPPTTFSMSLECKHFLCSFSPWQL